jgi:hypothetical protein
MPMRRALYLGGIAVGGLRKPGMRVTLEQTGIAPKNKKKPLNGRERLKGRRGVLSELRLYKGDEAVRS